MCGLHLCARDCKLISMESYDIICFGAGPTGLATAIEARRAGMRPLVIDKGTLCNSIFHYPVNMYFFTTPELLEIGDLPLVCAAEKPTRVEALKYYRKATEHFELELRLFELIERLEGSNGNFTVTTRAEDGTVNKYHGKKIAVATGYYDLPNILGVPGENLPNVSHYYTEPHPYWRQDVVVVGGKNSAAEAALDLYRNGARVTMVHRDAELGATIKYWVRPDIENRIKAGQIAAMFETRVKEFTEEEVVVIEKHGREKRLPAKQVFALTGYHPDYTFIKSLGVRLDEMTWKPELNADTLESNVPGIFLAGVVIGGKQTSEIFIENGRFHGKQIINSLVGKARRAAE
jgi:thioredoxin reductase (NADPH)